jgi:hypothetical protein
MKKSDSPVIPLRQILDFAEKHYRDLRTAAGIGLVDHSKQVARQAETIAHKLYQDVRADYLPDSTKDSVTAIIHGALLHDVLNVSACAFENIAEVSTVQVAAMVADISRDFRMVETKRDMEFRGRVSSSPVGSQIIVLADIICTAKDLLALIAANGAAAIPKAKKILTQLDGDLLALRAAERFYVLRLFSHAARNLLGDVSRTIKECRQKAKLDKLVAQHTTGIREKATAAADAQKPAPVKKKREVRYARKRSVE